MQDFRGLDRGLWHQRYRAQSCWTEHVRKYLFEKIKPHADVQILEVGSGTGVIMAAVHQEGYRRITGVDLDYPSIAYSKSQVPSCQHVLGDGHQLPFRTDAFEITVCHYLLIWTAHPAQILSEMRRVTQPGGWVLALAEPDHQARVDYPPSLEALGQQQTQALNEQGVDIRLGRKLRALFTQTGLQDVETGILAAQWREVDQPTDKTEWAMIQADLKDRFSQSELAQFRQQDKQAREAGTRVLFIPTFYALGKVP